jgi:uncharacterized protein YwgA
MGKGIALEFKRRFPDMFEDYVRRCRRKDVQLGQPYLFKRVAPPWILNFPTKDDWRSLTKLSDIREGLESLQQHYREWGITSIAMPPLGCGLGQLEWRVVGPTLYRYLRRLEIPVELYAPHGTPNEQLQFSFLEHEGEPARAHQLPDNGYKISPGWVALVEILARVDSEPYHWPIGRTSFQKEAYFATESGIPTGLEFQRGSYGPFSPDLKSLISRLQNNQLISEEKLGRMLAVKPGPTFRDAKSHFEQKLAEWEPALRRITDLFLRLDTNRAELAATVHFSWRSLRSRSPEKPSENQVLSEVKQWKQRRRPALEDQDVAETIRNLAALGWIDVEPSSDLPLPESETSDARVS